MPAYSQEALKAAAAELGRQIHGGPADPDDIKFASDILNAAAAGASQGLMHAEVTRLRALGTEIVSMFAKTSDGYRARVGEVQIQRWLDQLADPQNGDQASADTSVTDKIANAVGGLGEDIGMGGDEWSMRACDLLERLASRIRDGA